MGNLDNLYLHSMVHPDAVAAHVNGKKLPESIFQEEVPDTSVQAYYKIESDSNSEEILISDDQNDPGEEIPVISDDQNDPNEEIPVISDDQNDPSEELPATEE